MLKRYDSKAEESRSHIQITQTELQRTVISPLAHDFSPVLVEHLAGRQALFSCCYCCCLSLFLNQLPQVISGEIERHLLSKQDVQTILTFIHHGLFVLLKLMLNTAAHSCRERNVEVEVAVSVLVEVRLTKRTRTTRSYNQNLSEKKEMEMM